VEDVDICGLEKMEREVGRKIGGRVLSHVVQVNGLCRACATEGAMP
jgi:Fur family zinc uptake transcriptional regulator/Fur family ferric uptake transcriptional regulator